MKKILSLSWYSRFLTSKYEEVSCTHTPPFRIKVSIPCTRQPSMNLTRSPVQDSGFHTSWDAAFFTLDIRCHLMVSFASYNQDNLSNRQNSADASHSNFRHNAAEQKWNLNLHFYSTRKCFKNTISAKKLQMLSIVKKLTRFNFNAEVERAWARACWLFICFKSSQA